MKTKTGVYALLIVIIGLLGTGIQNTQAQVGVTSIIPSSSSPSPETPTDPRPRDFLPTYSINANPLVVQGQAGNEYVLGSSPVPAGAFGLAGLSYSFNQIIGAYDGSYMDDNKNILSPKGISIASDGSLYVVEELGQRLMKFNKYGMVLWSIGQLNVRGGSDGNTNLLNGPSDTAVNKSGNVFVADTNNHRILIYKSKGNYGSTLGVPGVIGSDNLHFNAPNGVSIAPNGNIFIADTNNHRIQVFNSKYKYLTTLGVSGESGQDNYHLNNPRDVVVDTKGNIYVADSGNNRVQVYSKAYRWLRTIGVTSNQDKQYIYFGEPVKLAVDKKNNLYVADSGNNQVIVISLTGQYLSSIGGCSKSTPGQIIPQDCIEAVQGIAVDAKGAVYTSSLYSQGAIKKFVPGIVGYTQKNINGFNDFYSQGISAMKTFNGYLYAAGANWERGSSIWRSLDGKNWVNTNSGGFGRGKDTPVVSGFTVFGGQLYASTATWTEIDVPGQIWRTSNGINWEEVVPDAFGVSGSGVSVAIHVVYNGYLYATVEKRYGDRVGAVMYRSLTGNSGSWVLVDTGNDNNNSYKIYSMVVYNGHLYAGADNDVDGMEIWSSPSGDSGTWEKDQTGGFGDPLNTDTGSMAVYNHTLYVGTYYAGSSGGQLWKFDGVSWSSVNTDGFGNSNNYWMRTVYSLDGYLYVITANRNEGQQIWRTSDGVKFSILNQNGLGSSGNLMVQSNVGLEVYKNNLFIGTWNKNFGGQVWGMNSAKFKKPSLTSILPLSVSAGSPSFLITITGTNFMNGSVIYFGKVPLTTTQVNLTTLEATVPAALLASPNKKLAIKVVNPKPGGGTSKVKNFIITP